MNLRPARPRSLLRQLAAWLLIASLFTSPFATAGVFVSVNIAPPPLPIYAQPPIPGPGYMWTPGYWSWSDNGYFWVPGTWVLAPYAGALWTPGYWGWGGGYYVFHAGYWGPRIGFYGGINYGFGYTGLGFAGGYWRGGVFNYNRSVTNISNTTNITNIYNKTVINNTTVNNRTSFNGGNGGVIAQPTAADRLAASDRHTAPIAIQQQHVAIASRENALRASNNHGAPAIAATPTPTAFTGRGVMRANAATTQANVARTSPAHATATAATPRRAAPAANDRANAALPSSRFAPNHRPANRAVQNVAAEHPGNAAPHANSPRNTARNLPAAPRPAHQSAPRSAPRPAPRAEHAPAAPHARSAPRHPAPPHHDTEQHHG